MNTRRCTSNALTYKGKAYVFGGYYGSGRVREIERYNPENDQFELI